MLQGASNKGCCREKELPIEVISLVAGGCEDLKGMRGVNKAWQEGFEASATTIRVSILGPPLPSVDILKERFPALTSLDLGASIMSEAALGFLRELGKLRSLKMGLSQVEATELGADHRNYPPGILAGELTDAGLEILRGLPLTSLHLGSCKLTGSGFAHLHGMPLTSLSLRGMTYLRSDSLDLLLNLPLTKLDLSHARRPRYFPLGLLGLGDEGVAKLRGLPLQSLNLSGNHCVSDIGLAHLRGMPLVDLDLTRVTWLTDGALAILGGLPLTRLSLSRCKRWTHFGLAHLRRAPLKSLDLSGCRQLRDLGLHQLHGMPLTRLRLERCPKISRAGLFALRVSIDTALHVRISEFGQSKPPPRLEIDS